MESNHLIRLTFIVFIFYGLINRTLTLPLLEQSAEKQEHLSSMEDSPIANILIQDPLQTGLNLRSNAFRLKRTLIRNQARRNVILPRICYFTRVSKRGIYKKLCLPYNE